MASACGELQTFEITACNCSQMSVVGALNLAEDTHCRETVKPSPPIRVEYKIFIGLSEARQFLGYACQRVRKELVLTSNFWINSYALGRRSIEESVTSTECWYMKETLNCVTTK